VLYGDTDSVFLKNPTQEQIKKLADWSKKELKMSLDVDKVYRYAVLSSRKKNYLGVFDDGSVDVKGLTGKKRHIPQFIKEAFDEMKTRLGDVDSSLEFETAKKDIRRIVLDRYNRLRRREWTRLSDLAFHVVLGSAPDHYTKTTPQHVMAARMLQDKRVEMKAGDMVSFVKIKPREMVVRGKREIVNVMPIDFASANEVDVDKYVAYLQSTFEQVLDALGLEFDEIIGLTKLERFM
jgi:DNA polymerase I